MILSALNDYYLSLLEAGDAGISQPGYSMEKISYEIVLDRDGNVVAVNDMRNSNGKKPVPMLLGVPQPPKRTSAVHASFLWDKTSYVLGISATSKRCEQEHAAFTTLHQQALAGTDDDGLGALLAFLGRWTPAEFSQSAHFAMHGEAFSDSNVVFRLDADTHFDGKPRFLHERSAARAAWARLQAQSVENGVGMCLVTGEQAPIVQLHPAIRDVNGAQSSGASLVSFNRSSFSSYGKAQGENAPVSTQAAFAYTTVLNHLLRRVPDNRQRLSIGDATVVFWAQADSRPQARAAESLMAAFLDPDNEDGREAAKVRGALEAVKQGLPLRNLDPGLQDDTRLYVLGLAPNAARLSVRFWETGTLQTFTARLARHFDDLRLEPSPWRAPPPVWRLLLATAPSRDGRAESKDVPPQLAGELARAILEGTRYPYCLLGTLIMRLRADGDISGTRVALCKAVLARAARQGRNGNNEGAPPVSLDPDNLDPGYLLGRLFSLLENTQQAALGRQINATIRDRYYGAASATPASVFPVLLRNVQHHLGRLRKDRTGLSIRLETEIGEVIDRLGTTFPRSLGIEAQGHFAIGYYHQAHARFSGRDNADETENKTTDPAGETA
jgi:CRISPR-associated protein Csd1